MREETGIVILDSIEYRVARRTRACDARPSQSSRPIFAKREGGTMRHEPTSALRRFLFRARTILMYVFTWCAPAARPHGTSNFSFILRLHLIRAVALVELRVLPLLGLRTRGERGHRGEIQHVHRTGDAAVEAAIRYSGRMRHTFPAEPGAPTFGVLRATLAACGAISRGILLG